MDRVLKVVAAFSVTAFATVAVAFVGHGREFGPGIQANSGQLVASDGEPAPPGNGQTATEPPKNPNRGKSGEHTAPPEKRPPVSVPPESIIGRTSHTEGRHIALTFDDGPDPTWTPRILELLRRYQVRATFCVIGKRAIAHPELVRRIAADGHALCNHSMNHDGRLTRRAPGVQLVDLESTNRAIRAAVPKANIKYFRAPEGDFSMGLRQLAVALGMRPLAWSIDTYDWTMPGVASIVAAVRDQAGHDDVVLLHDGGGDRWQTVTALAELLPWLVDLGYRFELPV
jgi:peptidoglycan/xylan/chitin deacetylase (PgdA/CDA1 family)